MNKIYYTSLFLFFCIISCKTGVLNLQNDNEFRVTQPLVTDTVIIKEYVADIHSVQNIEIRARVKGYLDKIFVDEGKSVNEGQVLFSINNQFYIEELNKANAIFKSAEAEAKKLKIEVNNTKLLVENNVISQSELDIANAKLEAANATIEDAKSDVATASLNLSHTEIRAPYDGVINRIPYKKGSLIDDGTLLTSISDNKSVYAYFNVSEAEYLDYKMDKENTRSNEVRLLLANGQLYPIKGIIETVEGEIDRTTGNIAFRAKFENKEGLLKHGASGKILLKKKIKDAVLIPQKSTFEIQDNTYVFVIDSDNTVQQRSIEPESRIGDLYLISKGISKDDMILFEGIQLVKAGDKIVYKFEKPDSLYFLK